MTEKVDVYTQVTNKIVADLERGNLTWIEAWRTGHQAGPVSRPLRANGRRYRGINVLMLWSAATAKGWNNPLWLTYKQASELGGQVRKGEKGSLVVYADTVKKTGVTDSGDDFENSYRFLKRYVVFNAAQIDGLPGHFYAMVPPNPDVIRLELVETFLANTKAKVQHGGARACYNWERDLIQMPEPQWFRDTETYYAVRAHETAHWTGHKSRLDREFYKKAKYRGELAREELVVEIGSAFICADLGITPETREDHAAYIDYWIKILQSDKRAIFTAASQAQKAVDYLHELQPGVSSEEVHYEITRPAAAA